MIDVGQAFVRHVGRRVTWRVVGITAPAGRRHVQLVPIDPPGERKTFAEAELLRDHSFQRLGEAGA